MYDSLINFYNDNREILLIRDGLRPAKSLTRNIFICPPKFANWYKTNGTVRISRDQIAHDICELTETGDSTIEDNIRNMVELKLLSKIDDEPNMYSFTRFFIDYVYTNINPKDYVVSELRKIQSINDITMLYNTIICVLIEAVKTGYVTKYPDSKEKFHNKIPNRNKRISIMQDIYDIYGFHSRNSEPLNDDYTPNANYRIFATVLELELIEKDENDCTDEYGNLRFVLSEKGRNLLSLIDSNIYNYQNSIDSFVEKSEKEVDDLIKKSESINDKYEKLYDDIYLAASNNLEPNVTQEIMQLDMPEPLSNQYVTVVHRDPQIAANAKYLANYKCEYDCGHHTFTTKANNQQYVEAHHLIPLQLQNRFFYSLDIQANVVALCPLCHRKIHLAKNNEKEDLIRKLYSNRISRLRNCNIFLEENDLVNFYNQ